MEAGRGEEVSLTGVKEGATSTLIIAAGRVKWGKGNRKGEEK